MLKSLLLIPRSDFSNRNFGLDLFRCLAVSMVLIDHALAAFWNLPLFQPIIGVFGSYGVDLFFVLSGFLIGSILLKLNNKEGKITFGEVRHFWVRRWFRTLPNYFLMFLLYFIFYYRRGYDIPYHKLPLYFVFLQNAFTKIDGFYIISWSLSVEEWFYFLFPLALMLFQPFFLKAKYKNVVSAISLFVLACLAMRIIVALKLQPEWDNGIRKQMPLRLDSIGIGVLAATVKFYKEEAWYRYKNLVAILGVALLLLTLAVFYWVFFAGGTSGIFFISTFFFPIAGLSLAMLLPYTFYIHVNGRTIAKSIVTYISMVSYPVYLVHPIIRDIIVKRFVGSVNGVVLIIVFLIITFIVSHLIYNLYEKRITLLRDKFNKRKEIITALS